MKQVIIMPGGFHPFHAGHYALYQQAQDAFPGAEVFVAATNDTSARPFPFAVKEKLAKLAGVKSGHFVQVKSPFQAREITANLDPANTQLIFVRSEKDANKPPQAGGVKKDGNPAYLQPYEGQGELAPMAQHAYMAYLPTVEFGPGMTSATEIRNAWPRLNEKRKTALVMSLYPKTQGNLALAANVVKLLDAAMGVEEQGVAEGANIARPGQLVQIIQAPRMLDLLPGETFEVRTSDPEGVTLKHGLGTKFDNVKFPHSTYKITKAQGVADELNEFAPDDSGGSRKFIPWPEFIDAVKQIVGKDFGVTEKVIKDSIVDRFVPHDPMEFGPTALYSYYERRAGRNKGAISTRGSIQVGKYFGNNEYFKTNNPEVNNKLLTAFSLLKGHPFERHFDLTFDNIYKIANIIMGNTEGAYQMPQQQGVAEDYVAEKK